MVGSTRLLRDDILRIPILFVNSYAVGTLDRWVLVDSGLPCFKHFIIDAVSRHFGLRARPDAIVLTHGHWDHAGSALALAEYWDVPIFAHALEMPYLTGKSDYAPKDPTVGGVIGLMARTFPTHGYDFRPRVHALPDDGGVPGAPEWKWIHTPGHTHGHVSLFRARDRVLLAGDAFATVNQDNPYTMVTQRREFYRPPAPFTVDWDAAEMSVRRLAELEPETVGAGHGLPISGANTADQLDAFARAVGRPVHGRYSEFPAEADASGIVAVPPPVPDVTGRVLGVTAIASVTALLIAQQIRRRTQHTA